jgi:hypothetical protein
LIGHFCSFAYTLLESCMSTYCVIYTLSAYKVNNSLHLVHDMKGISSSKKNTQLTNHVEHQKALDLYTVLLLFQFFWSLLDFVAWTLFYIQYLFFCLCPNKGLELAPTQIQSFWDCFYMTLYWIYAEFWSFLRLHSCLQFYPQTHSHGYC